MRRFLGLVVAAAAMLFAPVVARAQSGGFYPVATAFDYGDYERAINDLDGSIGGPDSFNWWYGKLEDCESRVEEWKGQIAAAGAAKDKFDHFFAKIGLLEKEVPNEDFATPDIVTVSRSSLMRTSEFWGWLARGKAGTQACAAMLPAIAAARLKGEQIRSRWEEALCAGSATDYRDTNAGAVRDELDTCAAAAATHNRTLRHLAREWKRRTEGIFGSGQVVPQNWIGDLEAASIQYPALADIAETMYCQAIADGFEEKTGDPVPPLDGGGGNFVYPANYELPSPVPDED